MYDCFSLRILESRAGDKDNIGNNWGGWGGASTKPKVLSARENGNEAKDIM